MRLGDDALPKTHAGSIVKDLRKDTQGRGVTSNIFPSYKNQLHVWVSYHNYLKMPRSLSSRLKKHELCTFPNFISFSLFSEKGKKNLLVFSPKLVL